MNDKTYEEELQIRLITIIDIVTKLNAAKWKDIRKYETHLQGLTAVLQAIQKELQDIRKNNKQSDTNDTNKPKYIIG